MSDFMEMMAGEDDTGKRLDKWLSEWADLSRARIKTLILDGRVTGNGKALAKPNIKVTAGTEYMIEVPPPIAAKPKAENIPLDIVFEDAHLVLVNKPAGMTVHPAVGNWDGTLVNALLHHCGDSLSGIGGVLRPGIVHRIDKNTSGILVVAKDDKTHQCLSKQFAKHTVERTYISFARSAPNPREGRIETRLGRHPGDRKKMAVLKDPDEYTLLRMAERGQALPGKIAITNYKFIRGYGQHKGGSIGAPLVSKVQCNLETGRTHQIRVHLAHLFCPLLGDCTYGKTGAFKTANSASEIKLREALKNFNRQALHAQSLGFRHPITKKDVFFENNFAPDMQKLENALLEL
ncbi:MAG: RluA family pseudouridine synthase [Robiginitomaculum sp.]